MNQKLLNEHINDALGCIKLPVLAKDGSNAKDFFGVDTSRKFALNYGGYPRSELSQIFEQENLVAQANLLEQMVDYTPATNPTAGLTDVEISLMHRSKYQQTPNEMQSWLDGQIQIRDAKRQADYEAAVKAQQAKSPKSTVKQASAVVEPE